MMNYYIYDKQVNVVRAAMVCNSIAEFKELREYCKNKPEKEYTIHINGKNLTFETV